MLEVATIVAIRTVEVEWLLVYELTRWYALSSNEGLEYVFP